jgi:hypothetical protein
MAASLFKPGELRHLVDGYKKAANTLPDATRAAAGSVGMEIKQAWLGIAATHGVKPGGKIARAKWNVGYNVLGGVNATVDIKFRGPMWLVFFPTKGHIIGARKLATRGVSYKKAADGSYLRKVNKRSGFGGKASTLAANRAAGLSNAGAFGKGVLTRRASATGAKALTLGGTFRPYVFHPGTKGKAPGIEAELEAAVLRIAPAGYARRVKTELAKSIGTQTGGFIRQGIKL